MKTILPFALGGFLVWYSLSDIDIPNLLNQFKSANYWWITLSLFFGILSHISRAYRWSFMLEPLGYKPKLVNNILAVLVGYLVNYTIPRAGEASRALVLKNYENVPFEKGFGSIVAERIADVIMLLLILTVTLFLQFDFIYELLTKLVDPSKIIYVLFGLLAFFIFFTLYIKKAKSGFALKIKTFLIGLLEGVSSILKMEKKWAFIFHTFFIWIMYILMFWVVTFAIEGLNVPLGAILVGFIAGAFSIAIVPGGIGSYPLAVAKAFVLFGIAEAPSEAFGWIMWTAQTAMIIVFGGLAFLLLPVVNKNK